MSWPTAPLGELSLVMNGKTPSKAEQRSAGHPVLKVRDVDELGQFRGVGESFVDDAFAKKFLSKWTVVGDTLILNAAHNADYVASKSFSVTEEAAGLLAAGEWLIVRPNEEALDDRFAHHWLTSVFAQRAIREMVKGIHLYPKDVARLRIPLPPLSEQQRIAAILDKADQLRRLRRQSLSRLSDLGQAIFNQRFAGNADIASRRIGDFADVKGGKRLPKGSEYSVGPTPHRYIRVSDLSDGYINAERMRFISEDIHKSVARYTVKVGDVVISIAGTIGTVAPVKENLDGANLTENAAKITPKKGQAFDADYVVWALQSPQSRHAIMASTGQVTIGKLALFRIKDLEIPFPKIEQQVEFAREIEGWARAQGIYQQAASDADSLFASLQHRAFRGEL